MFDEIEELLRETELEVGILNENLQVSLTKSAKF